MARLQPILDAISLASIVADGGYSNLVPMTEPTNLLLLSALPFLSERWIWETKLNPIPDTLYDVIIEQIDIATNALMTNLAIGSFFYSIAILTDPSVIIPIGQLIAQSDYVSFTAVVPAIWLVGADIQLPDMRQTFVMGANMPSGIGVQTGSNTHQLTVSELPSHNHTQNPHLHSQIIPVVTPTAAGLEPLLADITVPTPAVTGLTTSTNNPTGGDGSHNNVPQSMQLIPYIVVR